MKIKEIVRYCDHPREIVEFYEALSIYFEEQNFSMWTADIDGTKLVITDRPLNFVGAANCSGINSLISFEVDDISQTVVSLDSNRILYQTIHDGILQIRDPEGGTVIVEQKENSNGN